jgi:hypothetical protein
MTIPADVVIWAPGCSRLMNLAAAHEKMGFDGKRRGRRLTQLDWRSMLASARNIIFGQRVGSSAPRDACGVG